MAIVVPRTLIVSWVAFRGSLVGLRALGAATLAAIPSLIVLAIGASGADGVATGNAAQSLFLTLTVRVVVLLVLLVLMVGQFRSEIELDTLTYLSTRSISRPAIALGKYVGGLAAALLLLLPGALLPYGLAGLFGAPAPAASVLGATVVILVLAALAYGAVFLLLGLVSSSALIIGLVYGFFWEELMLLLPGQFPKVTVLYYLLSVGPHWVTTGPLAGFTTTVSLFGAVAVPIGIAVIVLGVTMFIVRFVETAPRRISA